MIQLYEATDKFCKLAGFYNSYLSCPYFLYDTTTQCHYWIHNIDHYNIMRCVILLLRLKHVNRELSEYLPTAKLLTNNLIEEYPELFI